MRKLHVVKLKPSEREQLRQMIGSGRDSARRLAHARVLLKCDAGMKDADVSAVVDVSVGTVERVRRRFAVEGLEAALSPRPQPLRPDKRRLDGAAEAKLTALACSTAPNGHAHWTMQLLAEEAGPRKARCTPAS